MLRLSGIRRVFGEGPVPIARQVAILFFLGGAGALASTPSTEPGGGPVLVVIAAAEILMALLAWALPWDRWPPLLTSLLGFPAFAILGVSTWVFGGGAAGTGPFFVLVYAWLGLHQPRWVIAAYTPVAAVAYLLPLVATRVPVAVLVNALVLIPISVGLAFMISTQHDHVREGRDRARRAEAFRSALMATLAHDIRNPLAAVYGNLRLVTEVDALTAAQRRAMLDSALKQTLRLTRLANGLLDVERVEQGRLELDRQPVSVTESFESVVGLLGAEGEVEVRADEILHVFADPHRLEQILINLVMNGLRHGRPPVVLSARRDADVVQLEVRDHGPGVPAGRRERLFERVGSHGAHPESVGLGLWIVQMLTEAHGGRVLYEAADPGARFLVRIPDAQVGDPVGLGSDRGD